jgi:serine phosphatase RsbU (regulator of sigma subunit)
VTLLDAAEGDLMLGVDPASPREDHVHPLQPGDTVWLYTDGLVERSDQPLDHGLARLRRTLTAVHGLPLARACDELLTRMLPAGHPDDVAVLAVRAHPEDRPRPGAAGPG